MTDAPNILWIMTDEQRCDSLGCYGSPWARTPFLDDLAETGTLFEQAYTPSPVCVAARAAMLTGYAPSQTQVMNNAHALDDRFARFLTTLFERAGYQTASFGKHHYNNPRKAFQTQVNRVLGDRVGYFEYKVKADLKKLGVVTYPGDELSRWVLAGRYPGALEETPEALTLRDSLDWLNQRERRRPFLLRISLNAPHTPVVAPAPFDTLIDSRSIDLPIDREPTWPKLPNAVYRALLDRSGTHRVSDEEIHRARQCYFGLAAAIDHLVGDFHREAGETGSLENTVVVYCSDHGAHLGDHGFFQKQSFFDPSIRVPFLVAGPGVQKNRRISTPVNLGSLLPSLLALCGIEIPSDVVFSDLSECLSGGDVTDEAVISEIDYGERGGRPGDRYAMVRRGKWKMMVFRDRFDPGRIAERDGLMLFDMQNDPSERDDLAGNPANAGIVDGLLADLANWDQKPVGLPA